MSRSIKRFPGYKIGNPKMKKVANRRIRHYIDISSGSAYKKFFDSYDICDYNMRYFNEQEISDNWYWQDKFWKLYMK